MVSVQPGNDPYSGGAFYNISSPPGGEAQSLALRRLREIPCPE